MSRHGAAAAGISMPEITWTCDQPDDRGLFTVALSTRCERWYHVDDVRILAVGAGLFDPPIHGPDYSKGETLSEKITELQNALYSHAFALEIGGEKQNRVLLGTLADWPPPGAGLMHPTELVDLFHPLNFGLDLPYGTPLRVVRAAGDRDFWIRFRCKNLNPARRPKGGAAAQTS